ncbi:MAG: DUF3306 domain-containing protein [Rhodoferax sp.]|nr:DUF3306 domain-containing protein [Rhodoferax sp.]
MARAVDVADGFLGRWSQRKQALREGKVVLEPAAPKHSEPGPSVSPSASASAPAVAATQPPAAAEKAPAPTLADVQALQADSSFAPFVARDVAPEVRNAAMKKLFTDPHYKVMDGLDIYIDDYSVPSPLPAAMLRQMVSAKFLKLFDEEEPALADQAAAPVISEPAAPGSTPNLDPPHDHSDLRLQPDYAARPAGPEREPERAADPAFQPVPPPGR